jgi:hypothetical protein
VTPPGWAKACPFCLKGTEDPAMMVVGDSIRFDCCDRTWTLGTPQEIRAFYGPPVVVASPWERLRRWAARG